MPPEQSVERLRHLDAEAFAGVVADLARAEWPGATVTPSPRSPDRGVDVRVDRDGDDRGTVLVHARQYEAHNDLNARAVRSLIAFPGTALVATTGGVTDGAREAAAEAGVELLDGEELLVRLRERGIDVPATADGRDLAGTVEELAARWSTGLGETATELALAVAESGEFERTVERADRSTDLVFARDRPLVRLRFSEAGLLVYVRADGGGCDNDPDSKAGDCERTSGGNGDGGDGGGRASDGGGDDRDRGKRDGWERVVAYPSGGIGGPPVELARARVREAVDGLGNG